jgi:asparagine synthase (glutamine-hydrolysing)
MHPRFTEILKKIVGGRDPILSGLGLKERNLISKIRSGKLTYLSDARLANLVDSCRRIEQRNLPGIFVEAGCALGGSAILISTVKTDDRPFYVYDVFGMIPPPTGEDTQDVHDRYKTIQSGLSNGIDGARYYGYEENLYAIVQTNLANFGIDTDRRRVSLVKGLVQDTMKIDEPVAFAHIDVDWYEPVKICLERVVPNLITGGIVILDDYHDWGGCRKATDEFFSRTSGGFHMDDYAGALKVTKLKT